MNAAIGILLQNLSEAFKVKASVRKQIDLLIRNSVLCKRAAGFPDADHLFQCVIGLSGSAQKGLSGAKIGHQGQRKRMGSAGNLRTHQGILRVKIQGVHLLKTVTADIIIAVAGGSLQACLADVSLLHRRDDPELIELRHFVDGIKTIAKACQNRLCKVQHFSGNAKAPVNLKFMLFEFIGNLQHGFSLCKTYENLVRIMFSM